MCSDYTYMISDCIKCQLCQYISNICDLNGRLESVHLETSNAQLLLDFKPNEAPCRLA